MSISHQKLDKLLQLFNSSEDEDLDGVDDDEEYDEKCRDDSKIDNDLKSVKEKSSLYTKPENNIESNKVQNDVKNEWSEDEIKVVELKVNPITIGALFSTQIRQAYLKKIVTQNQPPYDSFLVKIYAKNYKVKIKDSDSSESDNECLDTKDKNVSEIKNSKKLIKRRKRRKRRKQSESDSHFDDGNDFTNYSDIENDKSEAKIRTKKQPIAKEINRRRKNRAQVKRNLRCKECNERMKNEQLFMLHSQVHDGKKETDCTLCNENFSTVAGVLEHYATFDKIKEDSHYIKIRPFPCTLCDMRFKNRKHLTDHLDIHAGQGKYLCPVCGKQFFKRFNMAIHLKVHEKTYHTCERCIKSFRNVREYQAHNRNVHGENNIACPICNRAFSRRNNMKKHIETHGRVYNQCHMCNVAFKLRKEYNAHMREVHNRIKKYTCSVCSKVFLLHCKLTRHLETHTRIKDNCSVCDKEFRNRRDYNAHMRNMHGIIIETPKREIKKESQKKSKVKIMNDIQVKKSIKSEVDEADQELSGYYFLN